jgi:hypothetical protein
MSDDAEFDAFLKGEGALSRQLQALPANEPSAALDAAILQRARDLMAQEARPPAANDAGDNTRVPQLGRLSWRWRVPAGIAAAVLVGVFANQAFQASNDRQGQVGMPAEDEVLILAPVTPAPAPEVDVQMAPAARPVAPSAMSVPAPAMDAAPPPAKVAPAPAPMAEPPMVEERAPSAVPPASDAAAQGNLIVQDKHMRAKMAPAPAAPAAAPVAGFKADEKASAGSSEHNLQRVEITGSSIKRQSAEGASPISVLREQAIARGPVEWLASIEALLDAGKDTEALDQWRRFRQAHPYYYVPQKTEDRIKAIEK